MEISTSEWKGAVEAEMRLLKIAIASRPPQVLMSFVGNWQNRHTTSEIH